MKIPTKDELLKSPEGLLACLKELDERLTALESAPAKSPAEVVITQKQPKTVDELHATELAALEDDPEPRIQAKMGYGVSRDKAEQAVQQRKTFLRGALGIKAPEKKGKGGKASAVVALLLFVLFGFMTTVRADSQGFPSTFLGNTNLPATLAKSAVCAYSQASQATNYIPLRFNSGMGFQSIFSAPAGYTTNLTGGQFVFFYPTVDGTNAQTLPWAIITGAPNFTNAVIYGTNWNQLQLKGYVGMFYTVSNGCSDQIVTGGSITNLQAGNTNVYPAGVLVNRPNQ